jgi:hypothetical protein
MLSRSAAATKRGGAAAGFRDRIAPTMSAFLGGSAYAMARDISEGFIIANELTFRKFRAEDFSSFSFEADKLLREIRGTVVPAGDVEATKKRHRKMQRLQQAMTIAHNARSRLR